MKSAMSWIRSHSGILIVIAVYLVMILGVLPFHAVGYGDDFAYIRNIQNIAQNGYFYVTDWASATLIFQLIWGLLFIKLFGFSIAILHVSNLVLLGVALVAFYQTLRMLTLDALRATIFTLFLISCPWIFQFVFSFYSDVFYISCMIIAIFFYTKALTGQSKFFYILASLFNGFAFLNRQIGVTLVVAIAFVLLYQSIAHKKLLLTELLFAALPAGVIIAGYYYWLHIAGIPFALYAFHMEPVRKNLHHFLPTTLTRLSDSNRLYIEALIERGAGFTSSLMIWLLPALLIFHITGQDMLKILRSHAKNIVLITLLLVGMFAVNSVRHSGTVRSPGEILNYYEFIFLNWSLAWKYLLVLSFPIWIVVAAAMIRAIAQQILTKKRRVSPWITAFMIVVTLAWVGNVFYGTAIRTFPDIYRKLRFTQLLPNIKYSLRHLVDRSVFFGTLTDTWFVLGLLIIIMIVVYQLLFVRRLRFGRDVNPVVLLVGITFILHFFVTSFFAYAFWPEYTIPLIPLGLMGLAYLFRHTPIHGLRTALVLAFTIFLSIEVTHNRIQAQGVQWELGQKFVDKGIDPNRVLVSNFAWLPYWYFEPTFAEVSMRYGGNKYLIPQSQLKTWDSKILPGELYNILAVPPKNMPAINEGTIVDSQHYWIFSHHGIISPQETVVVKTTYREGMPY